jgi:hypothetical protein
MLACMHEWHAMQLSIGRVTQDAMPARDILGSLALQALYAGDVRSDNTNRSSNDVLALPTNVLLACLVSHQHSACTRDSTLPAASSSQLRGTCDHLQASTTSASNPSLSAVLMLPRSCRVAPLSSASMHVQQLLHHLLDVGLLNIDAQDAGKVVVPPSVIAGLSERERSEGERQAGTVPHSSRATAFQAALNSTVNTLCLCAKLYPLAPCSALLIIDRSAELLFQFVEWAVKFAHVAPCTPSVPQAIWEGFSILKLRLWADEIEGLLKNGLVIAQGLGNQTLLAKVCILHGHCHQCRKVTCMVTCQIPLPQTVLKQIALSFVSGWRAFSSVSLCNSIITKERHVVSQCATSTSERMPCCFLVNRQYTLLWAKRVSVPPRASGPGSRHSRLGCRYWHDASKASMNNNREVTLLHGRTPSNLSRKSSHGPLCRQHSCGCACLQVRVMQHHLLPCGFQRLPVLNMRLPFQLPLCVQA